MRESEEEGRKKGRGRRGEVGSKENGWKRSRVGEKREWSKEKDKDKVEAW